MVVSVPIRGLFNLTLDWDIEDVAEWSDGVSVPIRGLFNLTLLFVYLYKIETLKVSVPIRGLFNLTRRYKNDYSRFYSDCFRPHQGII